MSERDMKSDNFQRLGAADPDADGWHYSAKPVPETDARKLVTLQESGMVWIGIRAYRHQGGYWLNGGEPERAQVIAWQDLPPTAKHRYVGGILT